MLQIISDGCRDCSQNKLNNKTQLAHPLATSKCVVKNKNNGSCFQPMRPKGHSLVLHAQSLPHGGWLCHGPVVVAPGTSEVHGGPALPTQQRTPLAACAPMVFGMLGQAHIKPPGGRLGGLL